MQARVRDRRVKVKTRGEERGALGAFWAHGGEQNKSQGGTKKLVGEGREKH